ncbi:MAG: hypothetical protein AAGA18_10350 [Verrucomicrobiota bacterium]
MDQKNKFPSVDEMRAKLSSMQKRRRQAALKNREMVDYSLEGLRLTGVLQQLQALQAIQGLAELKPKKRSKSQRFHISENDAERAMMKQWLQFKADWLEALLEDAMDELVAIEDFEEKLNKTSNKEENSE